MCNTERAAARQPKIGVVRQSAVPHSQADLQGKCALSSPGLGCATPHSASATVRLPT